MPAYTRRVEVPGKTSQELYDKVSTGIDHFLTKVSLGKYDLERTPEKKEIRIKSSMFSATLSCTEGLISLNGQLSLLATPFKSKIDEGIDKWITKTFKA